MTKREKRLQKLKQNSNQIILTPEYGAWTATVPDLPGCMAVGETPEEALELLQDAKRSWLSASIQRNLPIPEPSR